MRAGAKRMIGRARAAREGRRQHAFYAGATAARRGDPRDANPHAPDSEPGRCWDAGWQYADSEAADELRADPPVCRFGPGGAFTRDWPANAAEGLADGG